MLITSAVEHAGHVTCRYTRIRCIAVPIATTGSASALGGACTGRGPLRLVLINLAPFQQLLIHKEQLAP